MLTYYSQCQGLNPMQKYVTGSEAAVAGFNSTLNTYCYYGDPNQSNDLATAENIHYAISNMSSQITQLEVDIACEGIQVNAQ